MAVSNVTSITPSADGKLPPVPATCEKHGEYMANRVVHPFGGKAFTFRCPQCAQEEKAAETAREAAEALRQAEARQRLMLDRAGIPARFRGRTFDNYEVTCPASRHALETAREYAEDFSENYSKGRCLIFSGNTGTGKTHLANAIANHLLAKNWLPYFVSVRQLVGSVKATWNSKRGEKSELQVIRGYVSQHLLIIDEVGVQFDTDAERMILFDVINGRYEEEFPTIILSNYPVDAAQDKNSIRRVLGDRIMDRLRENGGKAVSFNWESHRGKIKQ